MRLDLIKSIITDIDYGHIGYENMHENGDEGLGIIKKALEKQIPKKPILKSGKSVMAVDYAGGHGEIKKSRWQDWVCPVCGWFVGKRFNADQRKPCDLRKSCYCNECGQHIDWSEEK